MAAEPGVDDGLGIFTAEANDGVGDLGEGVWLICRNALANGWIP
jgi:hypothetical protein